MPEKWIPKYIFVDSILKIWGLNIKVIELFFHHGQKN